MAALRAFCNVPIRCEANEVDATRALVKAKGYAFTLCRDIDGTRHTFNLMAIVNIEKGTVEPQ